MQSLIYAYYFHDYIDYLKRPYLTNGDVAYQLLQSQRRLQNNNGLRSHQSISLFDASEYEAFIIIIIIILFGKEITIVTSQGTEEGRQPLERRGQEKLT